MSRVGGTMAKVPRGMRFESRVTEFNFSKFEKK